MSTTIKELSYLLLEMVNGGQPTDDSKINYRVAKAYIKSAVAYNMRRKFWEEKANSDDYYTGKTTTKEVEVKFDTESDSYYVDTLGESIDTGGTRSFNILAKRPNSRWSLKFIPATPQEISAQRGLCDIPNVIQFYQLGDKLYFTNGDMEGVEKVKLTQHNLLPTDDDDQIPSDVAHDSLQMAYRLAYAEVATLSDRINDGVSNL